MRFIRLYLIGYVILILGLGLALWQSGVLSRTRPVWLVVGALVAVGVGIMLSVNSGKPAIESDTHR